MLRNVGDCDGEVLNKLLAFRGSKNSACVEV